MKCRHCKTFKKADNCQNCFSKMWNDYWTFLKMIEDVTKIVHISTLDKIGRMIKIKREEIRNGFQEDISQFRKQMRKEIDHG